MRTRIIVYGALAVVLFAAIAVCILPEVGWKPRADALTRLWLIRGQGICRAAQLARQDLAGGTETERTAFPRWDDWPDQWRQAVQSSGLRVLGTDVTGGLAVTAFASDNSPGVRWFYIVPTKNQGVKPWFGFLAVCDKYYAHLRYPDRSMPEIEKTGAEARSPADLIRTLFGKRTAP